MEDLETQTNTRKIFSVIELTRQIRYLLEDELGSLWIEGEISNLSKPASGHIYFTIKDSEAQIKAAFFKGSQRGKKIPALENGMKVRVYGRLTVYEPRGEYQIIVQQVEEAGIGNLQEAFEKLKNKLQAEGLFDAEHKKPLPSMPRHIGLITSDTGAVIQDMLHVLLRRFPSLRVTLYPVSVQGPEAAPQIAEAIRWFNSSKNPPALLIAGRGGGSIEDLWAFNEEITARAIFSSAIPIISAVGHEPDFTIADFVADFRAPTPSAAAEMAVPEFNSLQRELSTYHKQLTASLDNLRLRFKTRFTEASRSYVFKEPQHLVRQYRDQLKQLQQQQRQSLIEISAESRLQVQETQLRLGQLLERRMQQAQQRNDELNMKLNFQMQHRLNHAANSLEVLKSQLSAMNPNAVLERGYSITTSADGNILRNPEEVETGDQLFTRLAHGTLNSTVNDDRAK